MLLEKLRRNILLWMILLGAGFFLFKNLGNQYLWTDEAETALLARRILQRGFPYAWDGKNIMVIGDAEKQFNTNFFPNPWLQYYITSLSFMILGESAWSARLPFVLLTWSTIYFLYLLTYKITTKRGIGLLAAFLLAVSVPFILYMRQCRYYALIACFSFPLIYSYYKIPEKKYTFLFFLFSVLLFFSHYLAMIAIWLGLAIYFFIFDFSSKRFKHLLGSILAASFLVGLWVFSMQMWNTLESWMIYAASKPGSSPFLAILSFLINLNMTVMPSSLLALAVILFFLKRGKLRSPRLYSLLLVVILANIVLIPLIGIHNDRYGVGLIPLFYVLMAMMFYEIFISNRVLGTLIILIFLTTNIFNEVPAFCGKSILSFMPAAKDRLSNAIGHEGINSLSKDIKEAFMGKKYYFGFLYEITHDYDGPDEGIVEFLNNNAKFGDTIVTPIGQNFIMFYCDDRDFKLAKIVENKEKFLKYHPELEGKMPDYIFDYADLDWFIPRKSWPDIGYTEEDVLRYIEKRGWKWERFEIPYPDIRWNNRPDLRYHYFRTAADVPRVVVYKIDK